MHLEKTISRVDSEPVPGDERVSGDLQATPDAGKKGDWEIGRRFSRC